MGEPVRFADDDARIFAQSRIQELTFEELRGAPQAAERILDFVRELANHEAAAAQLRQQRIFAREAAMLSDVLELEQKPRALRIQRNLRHRAVENAVDAAGGRPGKLPLHDALAAGARPARTAAATCPRLASVRGIAGR